jgi:hypothetical protein
LQHFIQALECIPMGICDDVNVVIQVRARQTQR